MLHKIFKLTRIVFFAFSFFLVTRKAINLDNMNQWTHRHLWYFIPKSLYTTKLVLKPTTMNLKTFWLFVLLDTCNHFTFTFHLHLMHLVWWYLRTRRSFFTYCCILLPQAFMLENIRSRPGEITNSHVDSFSGKYLNIENCQIGIIFL